MLQNTEYRAATYLGWFWRTENFANVMYRRKLDQTKAAKLLLIVITTGMYMQIITGLSVAIIGMMKGATEYVYFGLAVSIAAPILWAHLIAIVAEIARVLIIQPREKQQYIKAKHIFSNHNAIKIAVVGSYGKTTMKELLLTVLSEVKEVAATPDNKNVTSSHAIFANNLTGDEDILIIEYGEGKPGDVSYFSDYTYPSHAIITGIAPVHLDTYKSLNAVADDIFSVNKVINNNNLFVNAESAEALKYTKPTHNLYDRKGALGWKVSNLRQEITGMSFTISKGNLKLSLQTQLVGEHLIGALVLAVGLAKKFGVSDGDIISGIAKTKPHEHRMKPYKLNGAWIIDDTYNGNIEGIRAGTDLLSVLPAKRKIYVTPGLVDQGIDTKHIHHEVGKLISKAKPDKVVLIKNSVTEFIKHGLSQAKYKGEVLVEDNPLEFYSNIKYLVADGDIVMMQNDWTDNYK